MINITSTHAVAENAVTTTSKYVKCVKIFVFSVRCHLITYPTLLNTEETGRVKEKQLIFSESSEKRFIYCQLQRMGLFLDKPSIALQWDGIWKCMCYIHLVISWDSIVWFSNLFFLLLIVCYKQYKFRWKAERET